MTRSAPNVQLGVRIVDKSGQTLQFRAIRQMEGYDANTWTVPLLATHLRTQGVVISARTLRRRIHDARFRWKRPRYVYSERAEHVGSKKGALSDG